MSICSERSYRYDGSFEGLLCCVFESYDQNEIPASILSPTAPPLLFGEKFIATDNAKAQRVLASVPRRIGGDALLLIRHAFLTCLPEKEMAILQFLRQGYRCGPAIMSRLSDSAVHTLTRAVRHLHNESHLLKGFLRFSVHGNILAAEMEPKNCVLPLLAPHFCERYPEEHFLIYDKTHALALLYQPYRSVIVPLAALELQQPDAEEQEFRHLWRLFYNTIEIRDRHNPACRMSHMPKRYWKYLTEFGDSPPPASPAPAGLAPTQQTGGRQPLPEPEANSVHKQANNP
ncbi:MAG: TIGR03915 family putative DNA repair protein [Sporomusaceae bacterium]|nr:TIGR03915 family putative DNA repair protein [Sporomusaceae bacterium]